MRPDKYVALPPHEAARSELRTGRLCLLDGGTGLGKTTVALKHLVDSIQTHTPIYLPGGPCTSAAALHQTILFDLGKPYEGRSDNELRLAVREALLGFVSESKPAILVIDDAHDLSDAALDELRSLDNLQSCRIVLVAAESLRHRIESLPAIVSRVDTMVRLEPLDEKSSLQFLDAKYEFSEEATSLLAKHGHGSPRLLTRLGSLTASLVTEAGEDVEAALEALARLVPSEQLARSTPTLRIAKTKRPDGPARQTPKVKARKAA